MTIKNWAELTPEQRAAEQLKRNRKRKARALQKETPELKYTQALRIVKALEDEN